MTDFDDVAMVSIALVILAFYFTARLIAVTVVVAELL